MVGERSVRYCSHRLPRDLSAGIGAGEPPPNLVPKILGAVERRDHRQHGTILAAFLGQVERAARRQLDLTRAHRPPFGVAPVLSFRPVQVGGHLRAPVQVGRLLVRQALVGLVHQERPQR